MAAASRLTISLDSTASTATCTSRELIKAPMERFRLVLRHAGWCIRTVARYCASDAAHRLATERPRGVRL